MPEDPQRLQVVSPIIVDGRVTGFKFMGQMYQQENTQPEYTMMCEMVSNMPIQAIEHTLDYMIEEHGHEAPFQRVFQFVFEFLAYSPYFENDLMAQQVMRNAHRDWSTLWTEWLEDVDDAGKGRI